MRRLFPLLLVIFLPLGIRADQAAGQQFEGVIRERLVLASSNALASVMGAAPSPANVEEVFGLDTEQLVPMASGNPAAGAQVIERTIFVSGQKLRMEVSLPGMAALGGQTAVILDREAGTVTMLIPMARSYVVMDDELLSQQLGALTQMYGGSASFGAPDVRSLGTTTIDGVSAEGYEIRAGEGLIARGWTAPELRTAIPVEPNAEDPLATLSLRGLPLRTRTLVRAEGPVEMLYGPGYVYLATDVLSIERVAVEPTQFTVPSDYTRMEMGGGISGLPGVPQD